MKERIANLLLYAGVGREGYQMAQESIVKLNRTMAKIISTVAVVLILTVVFSSYLIGESSLGRTIHLVTLATTGLLCILSATVANSHEKMIMPMVYISYSVFYAYGIAIGTIVDPEDKTVLFMVMLIFLPIVFVDRPLHVLIVMTIYITVFIFLCFCTKEGALLLQDVRNALIFGFLGMVAGVIGDYHRVKGCLTQKMYMETNKKLVEVNQQLKDKSRIDTLTGMQNRNAYEADFYRIAKRCHESLACVYIDVNGLKSLNDTLGHEEGDKMLKIVAKCIRSHFGSDVSYRIGGDEFVAFVADPRFYEIKGRTDSFLAEIGKLNYYASVGWQIHDLEALSMKDLIAGAESEMYRKKVDFYKQVGFDRRGKN